MTTTGTGRVSRFPGLLNQISLPGPTSTLVTSSTPSVSSLQLVRAIDHLADSSYLHDPSAASYD